MAPQKHTGASSESSGASENATASPQSQPRFKPSASGSNGNSSKFTNLNPNPNPDSANKSTVSLPPGSGSATDRSLTDVIGETFPPFDHQRLVVRPFTEETSRDAKFEQELGTLLLDALLETHAWASARPKFESQLAVQKLENKISEVIEVEKNQEQTRQRLNDFVTRMKTALAALTDL